MRHAARLVQRVSGAAVSDADLRQELPFGGIARRAGLLPELSERSCVCNRMCIEDRQ
jgi:hypothetical protein